MMRIDSMRAALWSMALVMGLGLAGNSLGGDDSPAYEGPRLVVKLVDGSTLVCRPPKPFLLVKSAIVGQLTVPWGRLNVATPVDDGHVVKVTLVNGDVVIGEPVPLRFKVQTAMGDVYVLWEQVRSLSRAKAGK